MTRILVLNHNSEFLPELLEFLKSRNFQAELKKPMEEFAISEFDGVIASGGFLPKENLKQSLEWYNEFLKLLEKPFLGICLGLRIIAYCNNARVRKIQLKEGIARVKFFKDFNLAPGVKELNAFRKHEFELIHPLPEILENYAAGDSPVQAIKVKGREQFAVQFHPEKSGTEGNLILENFLKLCKNGPAEN